MIYYVNSRRNVDSEKSEPQMGFKPTTLHDLVGSSSYLAHMISLTASRCQIKAYQDACEYIIETDILCKF